MIVSLVNPKNLGEIEDEIEYSDLAELCVVVTQYSWSPGVFSNRKRTIGSLSRIDLLVLDVDNGCTLVDARERFAQFKHIIATSRNHQKEKNGVVCDRFRVVLFLERLSPMTKTSRQHGSLCV
jgi:hypothetical protein